MVIFLLQFYNGFLERLMT